jgi:glucose-6-phosphate-specific signal transduction histidine kinase
MESDSFAADSSASVFSSRLVFNQRLEILEVIADAERDGAAKGGHHIAGMRERVEEMVGELKIASARGKGTKITVVLPFNGESVS